MWADHGVKQETMFFKKAMKLLVDGLDGLDLALLKFGFSVNPIPDYKLYTPYCVVGFQIKISRPKFYASVGVRNNSDTDLAKLP